MDDFIQLRSNIGSTAIRASLVVVIATALSGCSVSTPEADVGPDEEAIAQPLPTEPSQSGLSSSHQAGDTPEPAPSIDDPERPPAAVGDFIRATITPGKPGAPTEIVEVTRHSDSCQIAVARQPAESTASESPDRKSNERTLEGEEANVCDDLFLQADKAGLLNFEVAGDRERPIDGSSFELQLTRLNEGEPLSNAIIWDSPIDDEAVLQDLLRAAGLLAVGQLDSPKLWYFPTE